MSNYKNNTSFANSEEIAEVIESLEQMVQDDTYNTQSSFSANTEQYPDNLIPFVDKHVNYLMSHKGVNPQQYLSNLRLMTRLN